VLCHAPNVLVSIYVQGRFIIISMDFSPCKICTWPSSTQQILYQDVARNDKGELASFRSSAMGQSIEI
jgi:hypothetical protein